MSECKRILVVDDDLVCAQMLRFNLKPRGYAVEVAGNGKEALRKAEKQTFDVVITDEAMPVMSGQEMCRHLRCDPRYEATPILFLTARSFELDEAKLSHELQIAAVMSKPFSPQVLLAKIESELCKPDYMAHTAP